MKKIIALLVCVVMAVSLFAACTAETSATEETAGDAAAEETADVETPEETDEETSEAADEESGSGLYIFSSGDVSFGVFDDADTVLEALGDALQTFEADSCAYQGKDYFYYYDGYQITVNDIDGEKKITGIKLVDDTVSMPDGIGIGSSEEDVIAAYGDDYTQDGSIYVYKDGEGQLRIKVENGEVTSVELIAVTDGENE